MHNIEISNKRTLYLIHRGRSYNRIDQITFQHLMNQLIYGQHFGVNAPWTLRNFFYAKRKR